jgi:hypothetical protein
MPADVAWPLWTLTVSAGGDALVVASIRNSRQAVILIVCGAATVWVDSWWFCSLPAEHGAEALRWDLSRALLMS